MNDRTNKTDQVVIHENAKSVAGAPLPDIPPGYEKSGSILLFYQYKEPVWTEREHKQVLKDVISIGQSHCITGRGRVAPEGLNCTLSGKPNDIRSFCQALRDYNPLFHQTDFKVTDGVPFSKLFKSLSIRKTKELVAYGLAGDSKAPSLQKFAGHHLEAADYHEAMTAKDTVIIDVRNAYESAIGRFAPPPGGAELIDPQMRNSIEFPKWLADERTQKKLHGKNVLMYCTGERDTVGPCTISLSARFEIFGIIDCKSLLTSFVPYSYPGGIRCERATALVNQLSSVSPNFQPLGVYELQGGIERYLKTFPQGGFWKGKNYLFDRRMEQLPEQKPATAVEADIDDARCVVCRQKWTQYRGKFKCSQGLCGVPVLVCNECKESATSHPKQLLCELCRTGYKAPQLVPDLVGLKRKAEERTHNSNTTSDRCDSNNGKKSKSNIAVTAVGTMVKDRLFLSRLPLTATRTKLEDLLGEVRVIHWMTDRDTNAFYGSCVVQLRFEQDAEKAVNSTSTLKMDNKKIKVSYFQVKWEEDVWPPENHHDREYPPIGR